MEATSSSNTHNMEIKKRQTDSYVLNRSSWIFNEGKILQDCVICGYNIKYHDMYCRDKNKKFYAHINCVYNYEELYKFLDLPIYEKLIEFKQELPF